MTDSINIAKIKLSDKDGKNIEAQLQFVNSNLTISDELINPLIQEAGITNITSCMITLGANNIALCIQNYTLTDTIYIDNFYNLPSYISILQVTDTNVHIVKQRIELLQADCPKILLADCQITQFDIGLSKHSEALRVKSENKDDKIPTHYSMESVDIRTCEIKMLKAYISCNYINIQESSIDTFNLYGGFGSKSIAEIKSLNIWQYTTIKSSELCCTITDFKLSDSSISNIIARANCKLNKLTLKNATIPNAYCFEKKHFGDLDANSWLLIGKSAENRMDVSAKNNAYFQLAKLKYKQEKGIKKIGGTIFGVCSGYGYKPFRAIVCCVVLVIVAAIILTIEDIICMGCSEISQFGANLIVSLASLAGQSGLTVSEGFPFWIANIEYIISVILFAVFVNALYVRYKD